jgi:hypothetical protein
MTAMATPGDLTNITARTGPSPTTDVAAVSRRPTDGATEAEGPNPALAGHDQGTTGFQAAAYDPVGAVSFEWQPLSLLTQLPAPVSTASTPEVGTCSDTTDHQATSSGHGTRGLFSVAQLTMATNLVFQGVDLVKGFVADVTPDDRNSTLIRNARTLVSQLDELRRSDLTVERALRAFEEALGKAEAFPGTRANWEELYQAMLNLRNQLRVQTAHLQTEGTAGLAKAAASFSSDPARVQALLQGLGLCDVQALQRHLGVAETGTIDGATFMALELMLLENDTVSTGALDNVADAVATRQVTDVLGRASLIRDLQQMTLAQALSSHSLSAESQHFLAEKGYHVDGDHLINTRSGEVVDDLEKVGKDLVADARFTLDADLESLNEDEPIHLQALSTEQQSDYRELRTTLDQVVAQTRPTSVRQAALQMFVSHIGAAGMQSFVGKSMTDNFEPSATSPVASNSGSTPPPPALTFDRPTLERWRTTGMTDAELSSLPANIRQGVEPFLQPTPEGGHRLAMSDSDVDDILRIVDFAQHPPSESARQLMTSFRRVAVDAYALNSLAQALKVDLAALDRARHLADLAHQQPKAHQVRPPTRSHGEDTHARPSTGAIHRTGNDHTDVETERRHRIPGAQSSPSSSTSPGGIQSGQEALQRLVDEQEWSGRLAARRFAQQWRNQRVLAEAQAEREAYAASLHRDGGQAAAPARPAAPMPNLSETAEPAP